MSIKETYIQYGVPSDWAQNYEIKKLPVSTFKATSNKNLIEKYSVSSSEVTFVKNCLTRQPADESVIQKLLEKNRFVCCLCKGQKGKSYIIHHIKEYSISQDNSYSNLAVLCREFSVLSKKAIVLALRSLAGNGYSTDRISKILKEIHLNEKEDYRVREEAKYAIIV